MPDRYPDYPHHTHIFEWLRDYADAFNLRRSIRFNTRVERAERGRAGGWNLTLQDGSRQSFDALLVCNGHHWDPRFPDFPGSFDGPTIHSHDYVDPSTPLELKGKRVLVVGIGNSAVDIVSELARKTMCETVYLSTRSGAYVIPKYIFGKPADQVVKTNPRIPVGLQRRAGRILPRIFSGRMEDFGLPKPNHKFLDAHPTVSSELLGRLGAGDAVAKGDVAELLGERVRFEDGSVEQVDAIIYATGYNVSFPFLDPELISAPDNVLPLFKRMLRPGIDDLAFIGLGQPIPTIFPFSELQSKLAARWLSGDWAPPAARGDGSGDTPRRGFPRGPLHRQAAPHHAARVVRIRARAEDTLDPRRAGAREGRRSRPASTAQGAPAHSTGQRSRDERDRVPERRRSVRRRAPAGPGRCFRRRGRPAAVRCDGSRLRRYGRLRADAVRRAFRRGRASTRSCSTTGISARATASPGSCCRCGDSSRTTPQRSPSRGRSAASTPTGSSCGAPPTPAGTSCLSRSPTAVSRRSSPRCRRWTACPRCSTRRAGLGRPRSRASPPSACETSSRPRAAARP